MVMNSDSVNRYGDRFTVGALVSALQDEFAIGVPLTVAHDASRIIGWTHPLAVHMEPGFTRFVGIGEMAENEDEYRELARYFTHYLYKKFLEPNRPQIDHLQTVLADYLHGEEKAIETECVALVETGLATRVFTELFSQQDKDGLIPLDLLNPIGPGVFKVGELVVFAHRFFRRNLLRLNTLNYPFLQQIQSLPRKEASARIALDPDMVGLASTYLGGRVELQYWWGPKFDDDLTSIPTGVTRHEANELAKICYGISRTEFRWGSGKGQRIFEAEELRDIPSASDSSAKYGCRYVHSIVWKETGAIEHFDGSIRMYAEDKMLERLEVDLAHADRHTEYTKLCRVDGVMSVPVWKRLLSDYFRDNYLVGEYLRAQTEEEIWMQANQDDAPGSLFEEYIPYFMAQGMGVRVALSYQSCDGESIAERRIICLDRISDGEVTHAYIESDALELKKALSRLGSSLHIPTEVNLVSFKDFYVNLPLVVHSQSILPGGLYRTIDAIKMLVNAWNHSGHDRVVSYRVGFPVENDKEAWISVLGHTTDLAKWLSNPLSYPPTTAEDLRDWSEQVAKYLSENFSTPFDEPPLVGTVMTTGVLHIDRRRVEWGDFHVLYSEELASHVFGLSVPESKKPLAEALKAEGIHLGIGMLVRESKCSRCGQPYRECGCSKLLDQGVAREITKAIPFPFWTDRPLYGNSLSAAPDRLIVK